MVEIFEGLLDNTENLTQQFKDYYEAIGNN